MTTKPDPKRPKNIPILSSNELINFIFISYWEIAYPIKTKPIQIINAG